jgi:hypothetical protein
MNKNPWIEFEEYLQKLATDDSTLPLCVVIGAGIHRLVESSSSYKDYDSLQKLTSWNGLLDHLGSSIHDAPTPTLRWEMQVLNYENGLTSHDKAAYQREHSLVGIVNKSLEEAEDILTDRPEITEQYAPLLKVLNSRFVQDVISYNIDLMSERLLNGKVPKTQKGSSELIRRHRIIKRVKGITSLRIWHPHGDRDSTKTVALGLWRYQRVMDEIYKYRREFKKSEKNNYEVSRRKSVESPDTVFDLYMNRPLLFIGTSLDTAELDQWYMLLIRWRNYAKKEHIDKMPPTWRLCCTSDGLHLPQNKFHRLEGATYRDAWKYLIEVFDRIEHHAQ